MSFSGVACVSINVVAVRRVRLVLGWVTVSEQENHLGMLHPGQLSLVIPPWLYRDSVFLGRHCNTLCTSGFVDDIVFPVTGPMVA